MAEEMVVEHGGHSSMNGVGAWLVLFFTITLAVIAGIVILDLVNKAVTAGDTTA